MSRLATAAQAYQDASEKERARARLRIMAEMVKDFPKTALWEAYIELMAYDCDRGHMGRMFKISRALMSLYDVP